MESNPWNVLSLEAFHFYCCPECDYKHGTKDQFVEHAMSKHPKARETIMTILDSNVTISSVQPISEQLELEQDRIKTESSDVIESDFHNDVSDDRIIFSDSIQPEQGQVMVKIPDDVLIPTIKEEFHDTSDERIEPMIGDLIESKSDIVIAAKNDTEEEKTIEADSVQDNETEGCDDETFESSICIEKVEPMTDSELDENNDTSNLQHKSDIERDINRDVFVKISKKEKTKADLHLKIRGIIISDQFELEVDRIKTEMPDEVQSNIDLLQESDKKAKCKTCGKSFISKSQLNEHFKAVHLGIRHKCDICEKLFSYKRDLRRHHVKQHLTPKETSSSEINNTDIFETEPEPKVKIEVQGENVKNDNQCTKCGHVCESETALITHIIGFHAGMKNLQPCCSLQNSKEEFMLHIMGHANANEVITNTVTETDTEEFITSDLIENGSESKSDFVTDAKSYIEQCNIKEEVIEADFHEVDINTIIKEKVLDNEVDPIDGKGNIKKKRKMMEKTNKNGNKRSKRDLDDKVQIYKCDHCSERFRLKVMLESHVQIFHKYKCDHCSKGYRLKQDLDKHKLKKHPELHQVPYKQWVSYKCDQCDKMYSGPSAERTLKMHKREKHRTPSKKYSCHLCRKVCSSQTVLDFHVTTHFLDKNTKQF